MLHVALLCLIVGQIPPPPLPQSYNDSSHVDQPPADAKGQRDWLFSHLVAELQAQGKLDAQKKLDIEATVNRATDEQLSHAVQYYQQRKAEQLAEAQANLHRLEAYRDWLKVQVERRRQVYQQEQAITAYGSALAAQQAQWAMGGFYVAPFFVAPPLHYLPRRHHPW